jgi:hypothetical protein
MAPSPSTEYAIATQPRISMIRPRKLVALCLTLVAPLVAQSAPPNLTAPSIESVVSAEGWTPTPSRTGMYRPGVVLVPNSKGGHEEVVADCIGVEPRVSPMAQSSIATSLAAGVSGRWGLGSAAVEAGLVKRLSFVDPEQRTISLGELHPTASCIAQVKNAAKLRNLTEAIVINDVLVAVIKNTTCSRAEASGRMVALGTAEASSYAECVQESDTQVPIGYKSVRLSALMSISTTIGGATTGATASADGFDPSGALAQIQAAKELEARLQKELEACLQTQKADLLSKATRDWGTLTPLVALTDSTAKTKGGPLVEKYVATYSNTKVQCKNALGERSLAVVVPQVKLAQDWLKAPPTATARPVSSVQSPPVTIPKVPAGPSWTGDKPKVSRADLGALAFSLKKGSSRGKVRRTLSGEIDRTRFSTFMTMESGGIDVFTNFIRRVHFLNVYPPNLSEAHRRRLSMGLQSLLGSPWDVWDQVIFISKDSKKAPKSCDLRQELPAPLSGLSIEFSPKDGLPSKIVVRLR